MKNYRAIFWPFFVCIGEVCVCMGEVRKTEWNRCAHCGGCAICDISCYGCGIVTVLLLMQRLCVVYEYPSLFGPGRLLSAFFHFLT